MNEFQFENKHVDAFEEKSQMKMIFGKLGKVFASSIVALGLVAVMPMRAQAEDGYELWLRHARMDPEAAAFPTGFMLDCETNSPTLNIISDELQSAFMAMTGSELVRHDKLEDGTLILSSTQCSGSLQSDLEAVESDEGYIIRSENGEEIGHTLIGAKTDIGLLYGVFDYLRQVASEADLTKLDITQAPAIDLRVLNHWDDLNGHVERGFSGESIWDWFRMPDYMSPRYTDYARANASVGINGTVLTNVNADATVLTPRYLEKVAALADVFRPYGIKVYLTARFSAPMELDGLETADPRNSDVQEWWKTKADEIYEYIPDFGGFLVKANSEGQPGPQDYDRDHAEGANMLADAVAPNGGVVMWRAFVYSAEEPDDRVKQAYDEFVPLDGKFRDNVLVQSKNGPLDFQPREPIHPLFGGMEKTPVMLELQLTKEYLGFSTHLAYLGPMWEEVLDTDTHVKKEDASVADIVDGKTFNHKLSGIAGVANIGRDRNWAGSIFDQANWYAFGRLAWNPKLSSSSIAEEWIDQTFDLSNAGEETVLSMMMGSREAVVDYMTPLGLTHLMGTGHHYGPGPWVDDLGRADWNPYYYHRATADEIGFDRTKTGSNALAQYAKPLRKKWSNLETVPDNLLLWFHRVGWDYEMKSGLTLWQEMVRHYDRGVDAVAKMQSDWLNLEGEIDAERYQQISDFLGIQHKEAKWWRDASLAYWMSINGLELPEGSAQPEHSLEYYKALSFPFAPGQTQ
ncbi:Alpha-glucuronidase [Hirschia baltica ATCC 49814]|uniref:Xylan alpha-1,2-glucuronidase n=2 Tax=Hirschia TaxID=2723 RepID=C6XQG6_HIRBI|nr:alpha-glucuronidase family glycosyl hydrolase [Hirschia baltica]ACT60465.1 Alpha-glucuronidase [Hirschia baltica ATCC 49814]